ncbi:MAG TPA: hypothetical protein VFH23_11100, partial [Jiangellaceae bacterium]|nr:hypothetical protein [Jiangellaceae bacterium]
NDAGRYFHVHTLGPDGTDRLVNTTQKYSGSSQISGGPQFFEVQAIGPAATHRPPHSRAGLRPDAATLG